MENSDFKQLSGKLLPSMPFLSYLIFFLVPIALLGIFSLYAIHLEEGFRNSRAVMALEKELETILHETDSLTIFPKWFKRLNSEWFPKTVPTGPFFFEYYRFDSLGRPIIPQNLSTTQFDELSILWRILMGTRFERRRMTLISDRWLGSGFPLSQIIRHPEEAFYRATSNGRGLICIFREEPPTDKSGTMFLIDKEPSKHEIISSGMFKDLISKFSRPTLLMVKDSHGNEHSIKELEAEEDSGIPSTNSGRFLNLIFPR
ncbi:hypothetical protein HYY75_03640 [bacterium]|nr:hypothetical protein [bacterium]